MSLDHGILNLPLAKRGNIDAQLDAYKAQQAAAASTARRTAAAVGRELKAQAKAALADLLQRPALLDQKAKKLNVTRANLVSALTGWSKWEPAKLIKAHAEWVIS